MNLFLCIFLYNKVQPDKEVRIFKQLIHIAKLLSNDQVKLLPAVSTCESITS